MKNAIILHGLSGSSNENWFPWLKDELVKSGYTVRVPDLPHSDDPDRNEWIEAITKIFADWKLEETIVIAHSLGVPAVLDFLELNDKGVLKKLVSVAGFAHAYGFQANQKYMESRSIDLENVKKKISRTIAIYSDNDPYVTQEALKGLADGLGGEKVLLKGQKHFSMGSFGPKYKAFPELLKYL